MLSMFNYLTISVLIFIVSGCGPSGELSSIEGSGSSAIVIDSNLTSITVERGPLFFASVKDKNGLEASNSNFGYSNVYTFETKPTPPIYVSNGYIDVNQNGRLDENDTKLDINMSSFSNIISPLTTFVGDVSKDTSRLVYLKQHYGVSQEDIFNTLPSQSSKETLILSNAIYKTLVLKHSMGSAEFNQTIEDLQIYYTQSLSNIPDLKELSIKLEEGVLSDLGAVPLNKNDMQDVASLLASKYYVHTNDINNSVFTRVKKSTDPVSDIWNIAFEIPLNSDVTTFDIGIHMLKKYSGTIGNIIAKGISIKDNKVTDINSLVIFGKKTSGSTGAKGYGASNELTKNSVVLLGNKLLFNLGYIIKAQTLVSANSFTKSAEYDVALYVTKVDINASKTDANRSIQTSFNSYYNFAAGTQEVNGTLTIND